MSAGDLTTVTQVQQVLLTQPGSEATDITLIARLITAASEGFRSVLGFNPIAAQYTEVRNGSGTAAMMFGNRPVVAVISVEVGPPSARVALVENVDYAWDSSRVQLLGSIFREGVANVRLVYSAGFGVVPADLADACALATATKYRRLSRLGQTSKSIGGETVQFDTKDYPAEVWTVLENYRDRIPV